jgi:hypothetical protein
MSDPYRTSEEENAKNSVKTSEFDVIDVEAEFLLREPEQKLILNWHSTCTKAVKYGETLEIYHEDELKRYFDSGESNFMENLRISFERGYFVFNMSEGRTRIVPTSRVVEAVVTKRTPNKVVIYWRDRAVRERGPK